MNEVILTTENFTAEVLKSEKPVLVDFYADWCGPCKMVAPIIEEIARDYSEKVKVGKINVDEQSSLAIKYGIQSIPTVLLFKKGEVVQKIVGYRPKESYVALL